MPMLDWSSYQYVVRIKVLRIPPNRAQTPKDMPTATFPLQTAQPQRQQLQQQQEQQQYQHQQREH